VRRDVTADHPPDAVPDHPGGVPDHPPGAVVVARDLAAGYRGRAVWEHANFELARGELVAVLGPNGAGKSTLLRLMLGLLPPLAGTLEVLGRPPRRGSPDIGYVPQARTGDPDIALRGVDLVALGIDGHRWGVPLPSTRRRRAHDEVDRAVEAVGAQGYATRRLGQMSGGERQRLLLAQALVGQPQLLLLDEPLANLDVRNQSDMAELVAEVARRRAITVVLVAHDLNPLRRVLDRVCYVAAGGVVTGSPEEVVTGPVLSRLYDAPVEVLVDSRGRRFVVGLEEESAHPHPHEPHAHPTRQGRS
jgi:zinc/manganese transport system ATP-binding protein